MVLLPQLVAAMASLMAVGAVQWVTLPGVDGDGGPVAAFGLFRGSGKSYLALLKLNELGASRSQL